MSADTPLSKQAWQKLFETGLEPQLVTDPGGRVLAANQAAVRLLDSSDCPLIGSSVADLVEESERSRVVGLLRRVREGSPGLLESEADLRAGRGDSTRVSLIPLGLDGASGRLEGVSWTLRQVGQPRTLVGRLQRTRQEASDLRRALDQAAAVVELDREGRVSEMNDRGTRLLGRARDEVVGCTLSELGLGPRLDEALPEIRRSLVRGRAWGGELSLELGDGAPRWVNATVVPLLDGDGCSRGYLALVHDVTRRRLAVERLERGRGLTRLGTMAAVVAHEVRNPLAAAQGALEVIGPRVPEERDRAVLADVIERLSRLNHLVEEILLYARPRPLRLEEDDLGDVAARVVEELRDDPGMERIELELQCPPGGCPQRLDPAAMRGVVLNLVQNAAAATKGRGRVRVSVERAEGWSRLRVRDQGAGVPEELREKIFEPFFTTRTQGSGLGLTVARHAVEQHGGRVHLAPAPGKGTDAVIELPAEPPDAPGPEGR